MVFGERIKNDRDGLIIVPIELPFADVNVGAVVARIATLRRNLLEKTNQRESFRVQKRKEQRDVDRRADALVGEVVPTFEHKSDKLGKVVNRDLGGGLAASTL